MVMIEALDDRKSVISVNIYLVHKIVVNGKNVILLDPPVSVWECDLPSKSFILE